MNTLNLLIIPILLSACVAQPTRTLVPPIGANVGRDTITCQSLAMQTVNMQGFNGTILEQFHKDMETDKCLRTLGYN